MIDHGKGKNDAVDTKNKAGKKSNNWQLIRDVVRFQLKLVLDGLRDVLLSPISIGAALYGIITRPEEPDKYYRDLLKFGSKSDQWINLFESKEHADANISSNEYINKVEDMLINEYKKGGVVRSIKNHTDGVIASFQSGFTPNTEKNPRQHEHFGTEPSANKEPSASKEPSANKEPSTNGDPK
ncbi:MAG: hypothetical protein ACI9CE_000056 [Flavobacterium sp.]|jgi:hypothetical protein